jgi:hypothetical protein
VTRTPTPLRQRVVILIASSTPVGWRPRWQHVRSAKDVGVYVTGEAIRGLADLEAKERERCADFASKAVAAGRAERTVRVAERS